MRLNCAFCDTKHRPNYIQRHVNSCRSAQLLEPEPPADFPDYWNKEDEEEDLANRN